MADGNGTQHIAVRKIGRETLAVCGVERVETVMNDTGCYVAFPEIRDAILIATALLVSLVLLAASMVQARRERRTLVPTRTPAVGGNRHGRPLPSGANSNQAVRSVAQSSPGSS